jgi:hypothetical protein
MTKISDQHNTRSTLPSNGDPFRDRIEFFRKVVKPESQIHRQQVECVPTLCKVGKDLENPLDRSDEGLFAALLSRFINKIRSLTE